MSLSYSLVDAQLQTSTLHHIDAIVHVTGPEQAFPLLQLHEHHVTAQLQEQRLLKVTQKPTGREGEVV